MRLLSFATLLLTVTESGLSAADWQQAAGPNGNFVVDGKAVGSFSGATSQNVVWRSPLPSSGCLGGRPLPAWTHRRVVKHVRGWKGS